MSGQWVGVKELERKLRDTEVLLGANFDDRSDTERNSLRKQEKLGSKLDCGNASSSRVNTYNLL